MREVAYLGSVTRYVVESDAGRDDRRAADRTSTRPPRRRSQERGRTRAARLAAGGRVGAASTNQEEETETMKLAKIDWALGADAGWR